MSRVLILAVRTYRNTVGVLLAPRCRFVPTCSAYAIEAIEVYGGVKGSWMTIRRLLRCHPWGGFGYDPVEKDARGRSELQ